MSDRKPQPPGSHLRRRDLLKLGAAAAAGLAAGGAAAVAGPSAQAKGAAPRAGPFNPATAGAMPTRNLGRTGFQVGIFGLGGQAALEQPENEALAIPIIERALDLGVNYVDTSARYGGDARWSERYLGQVMKRRRAHAFLATKTHDRTRDGSLRILERSLQLLQTDHVDLWQLHAMSTPDDVEAVCRKGGALEALARAKAEGTVRHVGLSGHTDPEVLAAALRRFPFDCVLLAVNAADPHHLPFQRELLPLAVEQELGIIGMKIPARGRLLHAWQPPPIDQQRASIKATRPGTLTMKEAMRYVLSLAVSTVIVGVDSIAQLEEDVAIARDFVPLGPAQLAALERKAEPVARAALWFRRD